MTPLLWLALATLAGAGGRPSPLTIAYTLRVDSADLSGFAVEMRIRGAPAAFDLAMARHPEYHDRYWRFVEGLSATTPAGAAAVRQDLSAAATDATPADSALWHVSGAGGDVVVRYRIHLPPAESPRASWRPFLSPTGGLVGGPHAFFYMVGQEHQPATVTLELPASWDVATALEPVRGQPRTFSAPDVEALVESPVLAGALRSWRFTAGGLPHRIAYWPLPDATPFDTAAFTGALERLARETIALFGGAPYRSYTFLFQDGAWGGLEHPSSVTLGAPSAQLARGQSELLQEAAHEFFHTWNLMAIRPVSYRGVDYRAPDPAPELWFSEGLTIFYADLLLRRAGVALSDTTRLAHLRNIVGRFLANPAYTRFSAEAVSRVAYNARPDALGDYSAGPHLFGEVIGTVLDLRVRGATDGRRSMDDVMRLVYRRFGRAVSSSQSPVPGFTSADVERAVEDVCRCDVTPLFDATVRATTPLELAGPLGAIGLRLDSASAPSRQPDGAPAADLRIRGWVPEGEHAIRLLLTDPASAWGRAGLHSGDVVTGWNGEPLPDWGAMRRAIVRTRIGDTVRMDVRRPDGEFRASVVVTGYERVTVNVAEQPAATERQLALRRAWLAGH